MTEIDGLITTLKQSLEHTKNALSALVESLAALPDSPPDAVAGKRRRIEAEIATLRSSIDGTEQAIASLTARGRTNGFAAFGIAADDGRGEF